MGLTTASLLGLAFALYGSRVDALVSTDGTTGRLPAMGWNSWNNFGCNINASVFEATAQKMVDLGLKDAGYEYINIDDCWSDKQRQRDPTTREIIPDSKKFPNGISGLADKVHSLGLKLGIYSDAGMLTCAGYAGSLGFEAVDAATFAKWGVDYLKYDNCYVPGNWSDKYSYDVGTGQTNAPFDYDWATSNTSSRYQRMDVELQKQSHTIQYSLCVWGEAHVERWGNRTGHSWRMYGDISPTWTRIIEILNHAGSFWKTSGFWGHNDWDMLEVGLGTLTYEESRSHFALWAALKSPLIIGTPLGGIKDDILGILLNRELIDFNQDPVYGASAFPYKWLLNANGTSDSTHLAQYWTGASVKGIHLFMVNTEDRPVKMTAVFSEIPALSGQGGEKFVLHDMWTGKDLGQFSGTFSIDVKTHDTAALRITKLDGTHPNPSWTPPAV